MKEKPTDWEAALAGLTEQTNAIRHSIVPEEHWALVANHLRLIEKELGDKRREIEAEATEAANLLLKADPDVQLKPLESDRGNLVPRKKRAYSFNTSGILHAAIVASPEGTVGAALSSLQKAGALVIDWKISYLENWADRWGVDLPKTPREIEDGDPDYLVGVVTTVKMERG